jgi:hypothetical protein
VFGIQAALKMLKGEKPDVDADNVIQTRSNSSQALMLGEGHACIGQ